MFNSPLFSGVPEAGTADRESLIAFCEQFSSRILAAIPGAAAEIAHHAGFRVMFDVLRQHGGTTCYLPHDIERCRAKLGVELQEKHHDRLILQSDSNGCINVPSAWGVFVAIRKVAIHLALDDGGHHKDVARNFGVTDRHLRSLKAQRLAHGKQVKA